MGKVLILSHASDDHARPIAWGLRAAGVDAQIWSWTSFPHSSTASVRITSTNDRSSLWNSRIGQLDDLRAVWFRRQGVIAPRPATHPDDEVFVRQESSRFVRGSLDILTPARWVNHPTQAMAAEGKLGQLVLAKDIGLNIPDTLATNDSKRVMEFYRSHSGRIIYKTFRPFVWIDSDGKDNFCETTVLTPESARDAAAIEQAPGIYQEHIDKATELRVTVVGERVFALQLDSQSVRPTTDWRIEQQLGNVPSRRTELPDHVSRRCIELCKRLGISYGAIDLIIDSTGRYIFLEVNQAGNFLFFDEVDPGFRLYQYFCAYLAGQEHDLERFPTLEQYEQFANSSDYNDDMFFAEEPHQPDPFAIKEARA